MLRTILTILIIIVFFIGYRPISAANILMPPSLDTVMKKQEKQNRLSIIRSRKTKFIQTQTGDILTYRTLISGKSITLSRYNEVDLWVQDIDLSAGAHIESSQSFSGYDINSGEPLFEKHSLSEVRKLIIGNPFSIINGQFFDPQKRLTPLSFGLKIDDIVRTAGADNGDESKNILIFSKSGATIVPYSWENLRDAYGYLAMVNLTLDTSHHRDANIGRTYICLKTPNNKSISTNILIFSAIALSESVIENELPKWGCEKKTTSKLDASGSARLWIDNEYIYGRSHKGDPDYRKIPHYLIVWDKI